MNKSLLSYSSRLIRNSFLCRQCRRWASQGRVFKEGDKVIVKKLGSKEDDGWLFTLDPSRKVESNKGFIPHQEIIGRPSGSTVRSHVGVQFRVFEPSLAEYVTLSRRLVTPIYPDDANLIVNLLDLHPPEPGDTTFDDSPLQILEVGTGQGSLTLYIAKAIHAYNEGARLMGMSKNADSETGLEAAKRRAILHTIDVVQKHSEHAEKIVEGFRHGLYADNVDFHIGTIEDFIHKTVAKTTQNQASASTPSESDPPNEAPPTPPTTPEAPLSTPTTPEAPLSTPTTPEAPLPTPPTSTYTPPLPSTPPFLSHIIIDTPSSHKHLELASKYLLPGGKLLAFNPSITQIGECTELIKRVHLPLTQETVLELGQNISGGRTWDVRAITPRIEERKAEQARLKKARGSVGVEGEERGRVEVDALSDVEEAGEEAARRAMEEQKFVMVCRPKVGKTIIGGGFVGVWRKIVD